MKLYEFAIETTTLPVEQLAEEFLSYKNANELEKGQVYWREAESSVTTRMSLTDRGATLLSFVSNDYLGLSQHEKVRSAAIKAIRTYGVGACAAPSTGGLLKIQKELERGISDLLHTEDTLIFNSGFSANQGTLSAIVRKNDLVLLDSGVHRSVLDGLRHCVRKTIPHNNTIALETTLQRNTVEGQQIFVVIDGVYSQDGDHGMIREYLSICKRHNAILYVDDAHGIGVFGEKGGGLLETLGLEGRVPLVSGSLSKAFGSIGGFVSGKKALIDYIRYYAGSCCFSVSLPPPCLASALEALQIIRKSAEARNELQAKAQYARVALTKAGFAISPSNSPIIGIYTPTYEDAILWAERLLSRNIYIVPIGYPAVSKRYPRLRLALSNLHSYQDIDRLIRELQFVSKKDFKVMTKKRRSSAEITQLIDQATNEIIEEKGITELTLAEICERATIEPPYFYTRYPDGFASYVENFIRENDFWFWHFDEDDYGKMAGTPEDLTTILTELWESLISNNYMRSSLRLELQDKPSDLAKDLAEKRDRRAEALVSKFSSQNDDDEKTRIQLAILASGLHYLALHKDVSEFCGIDFKAISSDKISAATHDLAKAILKL